MPWKSSRRLLCAAFCALAVPPGAGAAPTARPNIVFILADELGWADVAFHGGNAPTPHLDQLAREGLELTQHYVAPVCSPTRTGLMTGRCWSRFGVTNPQDERALPWGPVTTLVSWPGHGKPGKVQTPVHITDWLPTFAAVTGFRSDQDLKWDGTNCPNLGCYGDPDAITPNLDKFAAMATRYQSVFSVHPCCSPSRSCLVTGVYPTRLGTFQHRGKASVSAQAVKCFPTLLREAGYYTFNGSLGGTDKLDYNFEPEDQPWDKIGSKQIEWRNRPAGRPFFGQINLACTHQSQYGRRPSGGKSGVKRTHDPARVQLPPYFPDTPAVREIWAEYHDRITQMDGEFAALLKQLEDDGLAEDTGVFFFGDNGHGVPGGKVWLWDQGPHVPLLIRIPKRWEKWAPTLPGGVSTQLISFLDFAPTVLSLAGVRIPAQMQGVAFAGAQRGTPRQYVFAARDFHNGADFDTSRMVRDRRYHYIRNFMPHIGWDAIQYSWQRAPLMLEEWRQQAEAGKLQGGTRQACFFRRSKPVEELYDMETDPRQMYNLAGDSQYRRELERMRAECERWMVENRDLGLLSQYELYTRTGAGTQLAMGADLKRNPVERLLKAANLANRADPALIPQLRALLEDEDSALRRWGAIGLLALRDQARPAADALLAALRDESPDVRMTAAEALCGLARTDVALPVLVAALTHESGVVRNEALFTLSRLGPKVRPVLPSLDTALSPTTLPWPIDNRLKEAIQVVRSVAGDDAQTGAASTTSRTSFPDTRSKYYP